MEPVHVCQKNGKTHLIFDSQLSVSRARQMYGQLDNLSEPLNSLVLDAGQVEHVDTAAMQVLAGFCRLLQEQGVTVRWQAVSPAVQQASLLLGFPHYFENAE